MSRVRACSSTRPGSDPVPPPACSQLLNGNGEEARVVGGAVRNALLKIPIGDIDIATTALPDEVIRRAKAAGIKSVPTGIEHGTVTLVVDGASVRGHDACARIPRPSAARPRWRSAATGSAMRERRDFTINGLSVDAEGVVHDHVGGLDDIAGQARALHRRPGPADRRGLSAHPQVLPHSRRLRRGRARSRRLSRLHSRARRPCRRCRPNGCAWKC